MAASPSEEDTDDTLPKYGWRVHLDNTFSHKPQPCYLPRWSQIPRLIGLGWRFMKYASRERKNGRVPFIDPFATNPCRQVYGVPLGGIGCGSIGRGWKGDFNRWQLTPGMYNYTYVEANQFIVCVRKKGRTTYQAVLSPNRPNGVLCGRSLQGWNWGFNGANATYHALYPRAWTIYCLPGQNIKLICRQISPVFPHDYKDTSLPVAVFVWEVINNNDEEVEVSIMFTFQNSDGTPNEVSSGHYNQPFTCKIGSHSSKENHVLDEKNSVKFSSSASEVTGVLLHHNHPTQPYTFGIAAKAQHQAGKSAVTVTTKTAFDAQTPCRRVWEDLMDDGKLNSTSKAPSEPSKQEQTYCAAVAATTKIPSKGKAKLEFALCWDNPVVHFGPSKNKHYRFYTRFFGRHGNASKALCCHALMHYPTWESKIDAWQKPILQDDSLPSWYKSALFNELYFVADGGTIWLDVANATENNKTPIPEFVKEYGRFAYLEGHEYRMYNTYDVHFYASFALALLWPKLQLSLQYDIVSASITSCPVPSVQIVRRSARKTVIRTNNKAQTVNQADTQVMLTMMNGRNCRRKVPGCVPHDVGDPAEEPWEKINAYTIHDTAQWKDLNLKFVLQVYRDYKATKDTQFLQDMWPVAKTVMSKTLVYDTDGDGLIENSGFADQTYDAWPVTGPSAYCGGLWLASLRVMQEIATILGFPDEATKYAKILNSGKKAYHSLLWNGLYYNYDSSTNKYSDSIMADQMAGQWYLKACDLGQSPTDQVFPRENVMSALLTVYKFNVLQFQHGTMGAVNGMRPSGQVDTSSLQAEEVWTGVTYAVAAAMIQEGLVDEGFKTASGIYNTCFERLGMGFQTPEAIVANGNFRSLAYMRPLSIWAMQWALENKHKLSVTPAAQGDTAASSPGYSQCNGFCKVSGDSST